MAQEDFINQVPEITIDGVQIPQFYSLTQTAAIDQFQDTFVLKIGDPRNSLLWDVVKEYSLVISRIRGATDAFRVYTISASGSNKKPKEITVTGRSAQFEAALDAAQPKNYYNVTDNDIITEMVGGGNFEGAKLLKKFSINPQETRLDAATRAAKENGFTLFVSDGVVQKKIIKGEGGAQRVYIDSQEQNIENTEYKTILGDISIESDITNMKSKIRGHGNSELYEQFEGTQSVPTNSFFTGEAIGINRTIIINLNSKEQSDLQTQLVENAYKMQPRQRVSFTVRGRDYLELNQCADIRMKHFGFSGIMYLYRKEFEDGVNGARTRLFFAPKGYYFT